MRLLPGLRPCRRAGGNHLVSSTRSTWWGRRRSATRPATATRLVQFTKVFDMGGLQSSAFYQPRKASRCDGCHIKAYLMARWSRAMGHEPPSFVSGCATKKQKHQSATHDRSNAASREQAMASFKRGGARRTCPLLTQRGHARQPNRHVQHAKTTSVLAIDVLQTSSFLGCVLSQASHIELSAQQGDVKMIILESV